MTFGALSAAVVGGAWTLAWQAALLTACAWLLWSLRLGRGRPSAWAALWTVVLLKWTLPWAPGLPGSLADLWARGFGVAPSVASEPSLAAAAPGLPGGAPLLVPSVLLLAWAVLAGRRLVMSVTQLRRQRRELAALPEAPSWVRAEAAQLAGRLAVTAPRVVVHPLPVVPHLLYGVRGSLLVVPQVLLADRAELAVALAHELAHLRRRDPLARWLVTVVAAVWFFVPVRRLVGRPLERCQEMAADALARGALALEPAGYSRLLVDATLRCQHAAPAAALALGHRSSLVERVEALCLRRARASTGWLGGALVLGVAVVGLGRARPLPVAGNLRACEYSPAMAEALREVHPEADRDGDGELGREEACALQEQLRRTAREGVSAKGQVAALEPPLWQQLCCECESASAPVRSESLPDRAVPEACAQE